MKGYRLMIPGPVEVAPEVLAPMNEAMEPHYGPDWTAYYNETLSLLRKVFRTEGDIFLIPGTGSAAIEACLATAVGGGGRVLIPNNGFFGDRLEAIARSYTAEVEVLKYAIGAPLDLVQIEKALATGRYDLLAVTHCETSIGILNPIRDIGAVCRRHGVRFMVDAVSSLGVDRLEMDAWGIDLCATASQKGLESPPGLGIVAVGPEAWAFLKRQESPGWYLNLTLWQHYADDWADWHPFPITMAVNNVKALRAGIERILTEGMSAREERHRQVCMHLRRKLEGMGFAMCLTDEHTAHGLTAVQAHPEVPVADLLQAVKENDKILMAGSLGALKGKIFRIGHMGPSATVATMDEAVEALSRSLKNLL